MGLVDNGAGGQFIDQNYTQQKGYKTRKLEEPMIAYNVDGTRNNRGTITSFIDLTVKINEQWMNLRLLIAGLGKQKIILGFPWLNEHNPDINWRTGEFSWRPRRPLKIKRRNLENLHPVKPLAQAKKLARQAMLAPVMIEETDKDAHLNETQNPVINETDILTTLVDEEEVWINTKTSNAIKFHLQHDEKKEDLPLKEQIPKAYHEYLRIFNENEADQFPESQPWDHRIELKEGFQPKSFKSYNLTPEEQNELDKFLKEILEKGYIRPSQSPMATPFFFVKKKDGKLRPCQDYRYLNEKWTIKNAYPLPLISELTDKIKDTKYFTKLDVRWGYNNIQIRNSDQWKAAFKTNRGLFESTVMFFRMCNSPATFSR